MTKQFKIPNPYPPNRKGKINPNSEGNTDLPDGRSASAAFQKRTKSERLIDREQRLKARHTKAIEKGGIHSKRSQRLGGKRIKVQGKEHEAFVKQWKKENPTKYNSAFKDNYSPEHNEMFGAGHTSHNRSENVKMREDHAEAKKGDKLTYAEKIGAKLKDELLKLSTTIRGQEYTDTGK